MVEMCPVFRLTQRKEEGKKKIFSWGRGKEEKSSHDSYSDKRLWLILVFFVHDLIRCKRTLKKKLKREKKIDSKQKIVYKINTNLKKNINY
uniref:Uncharacterized protein n=1 Tax=Octopus bimaculoides TaxID=37653 RepID=A0A0L8HQH5_OCTBM